MVKLYFMKNFLSGFTLEDVLFIIALQSRTGELLMESGNNIGSMLFHDGKILQAFSPYSRAIGDLLVEDGVITDAELLDALKVQKRNPENPLGTLLLKSGKVEFEVIEMMVHEQIRQSVREFRSWNGANFSFVKSNISPFDTIHLMVHEFISSEVLKSALESISLMEQDNKNHSAPASP